MRRIGEITADCGAEWEVTFCRPEDCANCHACEGGQEATSIRVGKEGFPAALGDWACVDLPTGTVVKASLLAYALPIAGLLAGLLLGTLFPAEDTSLISALCGLAGLGLCVGAVALGDRHRRSSSAWQPKLVRVLPRAVYEVKPTTAT